MRDHQPALLFDVRAVTPDGIIERATIELAGGAIAAIRPTLAADATRAGAVDGRGRLALPGYVDAHLHGFGGRAVLEGSPDALRSIAAALPRHGVTSFLASVSPDSRERTLAQVGAAVAVAGESPAAGAAALAGVHWESPFVNPDNRGGLDPRFIVPPDEQFATEVVAAARGLLRQVTIAPELPGADRLQALFADAGVAVALGHTLAGYDLVAAAIGRGARRATHFYNAMRGFSHRDPGAAGAFLDAAGPVALELIADGFHVHPAAVRVAWRLRGADGVTLVTDAMPPTGTDLTEFELSPGVTATVRGGRTWLEPGGILAGSVLTMDEAVRNLARWTGALPAELALASSGTAARSLGLADRGALAPGMRADVVLLDDGLAVRATIVGGRVAWDGIRDGRWTIGDRR